MINTNNSKNTNNEVVDTINNLLTSSKRDLLKKEFKTTIKPNAHNLLLDDTNLLKKTASFRNKKATSNSYIQSKSFEEDEIAKNKLLETFSMFSNKQKKDLKEYLKDESSLSNSSKTSKSNSDSNTKNDQSKKTSSSELKSRYSSEEEESEDDFEKDNRKLIKREKICDTDSEDSESEDEKKTKCLILPDSLFKQFWDVLIACLVLYSSVVTPYKIAFKENNTKEDTSDIIIDLILLIDIILNFFCAYYDKEENLVKNHKQIVIKYLQGWFIIDFISIFPFWLFLNGKSNGLTKFSKMSRIPKVYKLTKLIKVLRLSKMRKKGATSLSKIFFEKFKINANVEKLITFLITFLLLSHLSTCIWYFVAKLEDLNPNCWVVRLGYIDASNFQIYILSFYWTLMTVTTVGYGDVSAGTTIERIYNLFIMSFGVLMYSFAIGSLSSIVAAMDQKTEEMNEKLKILASIKKEYHLDKELYDKVRKVIKFDLSRNQKDKMEFLQELPNKLRIELSQIMHDKVVQNLYFFKDQPSDFFAYVAPLLKPVKFGQNDFLYKCDDMIDEMYFITKGTIIFSLDKKYWEREIKEIKKNNNFGEIEMCLNEKLRFNIKVKSRNCELFVLKKSDFLRLSVNFKEFIEKFLHKSLMIYLKYNEERKKIISEYDDMMRKIKEHDFGKDKNSDEDEKKVDDKEMENIEAILGYLDENNITFPEGENNPRTLLQQLKNENSKEKKEEILSKVENILKDLYKD